MRLVSPFGRSALPAAAGLCLKGKKMRYEEYIKTQFKKLQNSAIIPEEKIPNLDLYIDQAEMFFRKQLEGLDLSGEKGVLTKAMINNYTKNDLIPRPEGKKYTKSHMVMLAMIIYLKGIFKIEEIELLMKPLVENQKSEFEDHIDPAMLYNTACSVNGDYVASLSAQVDGDIDQIKKRLEETDIADDQRMEIFILILALAMKANAAKYTAARLLETYFINPEKERKEKVKKPKKSEEK